MPLWMKERDVPIDKLLTMEDLLKLPDGTALWVIWGGGNGPAVWFLYHYDPEIIQFYRISRGGNGPHLIYEFVDHVGIKPTQERCWLVENIEDIRSKCVR